MHKNDRERRDVLLQHFRDAMGYFETCTFDQLCDELIILAIGECQPKDRIGAIGRALIRWQHNEQADADARPKP